MSILITLYAAIILCGAGFRYYRWYDATYIDPTWKAHLLQWWWVLGSMVAIYAFRLLNYDTIFRVIGEGVGVIGAGVLGYVIAHAYISERM